MEKTESMGGEVRLERLVRPPYSLGECCGCFKDGLLKEVKIDTCYGGPVPIPLCLTCRVTWTDDRHARLAV